MQEQVNDKTIAVSVSAAKFTGRTLEKLVQKMLSARKKQPKSRGSPQIYKGERTVKQLIGQGEGIQNIELNDESSRRFRKIARKYNVDFALKRDTSGEKPKFLVFFKGKDAGSIKAAFNEYNAKIVKKEKPSVIEKVKQKTENIKKEAVYKVKNKRQERER